MNTAKKGNFFKNKMKITGSKPQYIYISHPNPPIRKCVIVFYWL